MVRIRPQSTSGEPVDSLIEDPWKSFDCDITDNNGCKIEFEDPDFTATGRDAVYYVRALQVAQKTINAGGLRCDLDEQGQCIKVNACYGDDRTDPEDLCAANAQARAWSSPIFVDFRLADSPDI